MNRFLAIRHSHPLEREYEAWIVDGIERYFRAIAVPHAIWAVSPAEEASWPDDERLLVANKVIGIQFKRPKLAGAVPNFDRLNWPLNGPPGQFNLIFRRPEIYYCLPTFVNRNLRSEALNHCLFWRPDAIRDTNVWYENPAARTPYCAIKGAARWGLFVEQLLSCKIGVLNSSSDQTKTYLGGFYDSIRQQVRDRNDVPDSDEQFDRWSETPGLYLLVVASDLSAVD